MYGYFFRHKSTFYALQVTNFCMFDYDKEAQNESQILGHVVEILQVLVVKSLNKIFKLKDN